MHKFFLASFPLAIALFTCDATEVQANDEENYVLKTYEVGDLVFDVSDRPFSDSLRQPTRSRAPFGGGGGLGGGGLGGGGTGGGGMGYGGMAGPPPTTNPDEVSIGRLVDVIQSTIDPDGWVSAGNQGEIQPFGTSLVISQTPATHQAIEGLLNSLRQGSANRKTLTVDARWLLLDSDSLDQLTASKGGQGNVDRAVLARLTRQPESLRAITKCFSGQLVYLTSGTRRNIVESWIPVVGAVQPTTHEHFARLNRSADIHLVQFGGGDKQPQSSVGYQPIIKSVNFGSMLEIRPTHLIGSQTVVADLKSTITGAGGPQRDAVRAYFSQGPPAVDPVSIETQEISTTLRMPIGQPILVGGMTYHWPNRDEKDTQATGQQEPAGENRQMYLVLEIR